MWPHASIFKLSKCAGVGHGTSLGWPLAFFVAPLSAPGWLLVRGLPAWHPAAEAAPRDPFISGRGRLKAAAQHCASTWEEACCTEEREGKREKEPKARRPSEKADHTLFWVCTVTLIHWAFGGLLSCCLYCCRTAAVIPEDEREAEAPRSPVEERVLTQQQLTALRLRRRGLGGSTSAGAI